MYNICIESHFHIYIKGHRVLVSPRPPGSSGPALSEMLIGVECMRKRRTLCLGPRCIYMANALMYTFEGSIGIDRDPLERLQEIRERRRDR